MEILNNYLEYMIDWIDARANLSANEGSVSMGGVRVLRERIRELEFLLADAHIVEMHPEFHGRCVKRICELEADNKKLREALRALVDRLNFVHQDPAYISVWTINQIHNGQYQGPKYESELKAAEEILKDS